MMNPSIEQLLEKVECKYTIVILTSKRARQLIDLEIVKDENPLTTAINEVNDGKIGYIRTD